MQRIYLPEHTILIIPEEGEIKREEVKKEEIKPKSFDWFEAVAPIWNDYCRKSKSDMPTEEPDEPEPRYIPINQQQRKEEVAWLIKQLRATDYQQYQDIIKRIIDKIS